MGCREVFTEWKKVTFDIEVQVDMNLGDLSLEEFVKNSQLFIINKEEMRLINKVVVKSANGIEFGSNDKYLFVLEVTACTENFEEKKLQKWAKTLKVAFYSTPLITTKVKSVQKNN